MDDKEEQKKQTKRDWGKTLGNIVQVIKYLKNPIILKIVIILLIIILIIGVIAFFTSLPSTALGWIANLLVKKDPLDVTNEEILDLCKYIEEKGYDLEGYGFVEEITRDGEKTYDDTQYEGNYPSKGKITSVKSKYIEAYLVAEKKSYVIADLNEDYDFTNRYSTERIAEAVFLKIWPIGEEGAYFENAIANIYEFDGEYYNIKDNYKINIEKFDKIKNSDLRNRIKEMMTLYIKVYYESFSMTQEENKIHKLRRKNA